MKRIVLVCFLFIGCLISCNEETLVLEGPLDDEVVSADDDTTSNDDTSDGNNDQNTDSANDATSACNDTSVNETDIVSDILILVNEHRQSIGKSTLTFNCVATQLAIEHNEYMIAQNQISHDGFSERFQKLQEEVNARSAGENVASGYTSAESVMNAWLNSEGHKANIEGNFTHIGIAAVRNQQGRLYYTQLFYR